jgi:ABC-type phosphate transport system substrate-binding protein
MMAVPVAAVAEEADLAVIVNAENPVTRLTLQELTRIFKLSRTRWDDGTGITLYLPPRNTPASQALVTRVFQLQSEVAVSRYYLRAIFQQRISSQPVRCTSSDDAIHRVRAERGAIAIVELGQVRDTRGIRVMTVEGL